MNLNAVVTGKTFVKNAKGGLWKLEYTTEGGDDRSINLLNKDKGKIDNINVGDNVALVLNQNGRGYWELEEISVTPTEPKPQSKSAPYNKSVRDEETNLRIARSVALKAATDLVSAMLKSENKHYKQTVTPDVLGVEILQLSRDFEKYLVLEDGQEEIGDVDVMLPEEVEIN